MRGKGRDTGTGVNLDFVVFRLGAEVQHCKSNRSVSQLIITDSLMPMLDLVGGLNRVGTLALQILRVVDQDRKPCKNPQNR